MSTSTDTVIRSAIAALGDGPLTAASLETHVRPLFSRALRSQPERVYLANQSLGRPLDRMENDIQEGLAAWYARPGGTWEAWRAEGDAFRARLAALLGVSRPDAVIPKGSAGQGLRAVLNSYERPLRVVTTGGEFDSVDVILREYARRGRLALTVVAARDDGGFASDDIVDAIAVGTDLVVLSPVMFQTGQRLDHLEGIVTRARERGARVLLDVYHALGVLPLDLHALDVDFAIGGSYKYLRGGPGACFLYVSPRWLDAGLRTLDIGWFAKQSHFEYQRPDPPRYAPGGDGWLESTPSVLPFYQARAGQIFTLAIGVDRLRAWSLELQRLLVAELAGRGIEASGATADRGAFVVVRDAEARARARALDEAGVTVDARGEWLRLCPDVLTTRDELLRAAAALARARRTRG